jgi:integrase
MRRKLTELAVERLKQPGEYWDSILPSFGLRVGARSKTWIVVRRRGKHPTRIKLGRYPAMSLTEARAKARDVMAGGTHTSGTKMVPLVNQFLAHGRSRTGKPLRPATLNAYRGILHGAAQPLHDRPVAEIRRRDIAALTNQIAITNPPMAELTRSVLSRFWGWLVATDVVDANVVRDSPSYAVAKRSRTLSDAELRVLWAATEEPIDYHVIIRVLLWTGCRRSEAGGLRWSELRLDQNDQAGVWTIPTSRAKNHKELVLPIPRQMIEALAAWPRIHGRDHLFGYRSPSGFTRWEAAKRQLDERLGFNQSWAIHDIRRSVETKLAELGVSRDVRARILNHDIGPIAETYDRYQYFNEKRDALQLWADKIKELLSTTS